MNIDQHTFPGASQFEIECIDELVSKNETKVHAALSAFHEGEGEPEIYRTSRTHYSNIWMAMFQTGTVELRYAESDVEREKKLVKALFWFYGFMWLAASAYAISYGISAGQIRNSLLQVAGLTLSVSGFLVLAWNSQRGLKKAEEKLSRIRFNHIFRDAWTKCAGLSLESNAINFVAFSKDEEDAAPHKILYSDIQSTLLMPENPVGLAVHIISKTGRSFIVIDPEGQNGESANDLVALINSRVSDAALFPFNQEIR